MEADDLPELKTAEDVWAFLALKQANGMSLKQVLDLHTLILTRIGRDYINTWGATSGEYERTSEMWRYNEGLKAGAQYVLIHLEEDNEWYDVAPDDDLQDWD